DREVWESPVGGRDRPRFLVRLHDVRELGAIGIHDPRAASLAWGGPGLAVFVTDGRDNAHGLTALVVVDPHGRSTTVGLGGSFANQLAWQPGGSLLAFTDFTVPANRFFETQPSGGELRVYDVRSGQLRQLAASPGDFTGLVWSPDGRTVVSGWNQDKIMFVDVRTGAMSTRTVPALPLAWAAK